MRGDPRRLRRVQLAERLGIAPSRLEGRTRRTHLRPDGEGGFFVEQDPEFTNTDIALLYAAAEVDRTTTDRGFNIADEITPLADRGNPNATHYFVADEVPTYENHAVAALAAAERRWRERNKDEPSDGLTWTVEKVRIKR